MHWYLTAFQKYAVFNGRASRSEYWGFALVSLCVSMVLRVVDGTFKGGSADGTWFVSDLYMLATILPGIAVGVRRMHDIDRSGWWVLLPLVNLVFVLMEGTSGENRFGPSPKRAGADLGSDSSLPAL